MNSLKIFYTKTYYFWFVTRILYAIISSVAISNLDNWTDIPRISVNVFFIIYLLSIVYLSIIELFKRVQPKKIKWFVGIVSILFGIFLNYLLIFEFNQTYVFLAFAFTFWIIFYGIWELIRKEKPLLMVSFDTINESN
jgi:hypothetical protein